MAVIGWDIGGVNTKVARVEGGVVHTALSHPFEVQRDPNALTSLLIALAQQVGASRHDPHAVTMTAELSQMFRAKRDGVAFVLDAVASAFQESDVHVYSVDGRFLSAISAKDEPLAVAASNWAATARVVALDHPDSILIDVGTTTADIIPIIDGVVVAVGSTDTARLASGELVYTGALRTPVEAIVQHVPIGCDTVAVSAEGFALIGDVHVWRGELSPEDYSVSTPDRRPATRQFARERIARIVCADCEMLDDVAISRIADAVAAAQSAQIARAIRTVRARHPSLRTAVVTGLGAFVAARAASEAGLTVMPLADTIGAAAARSAPAAAVALLLERERGSVTRSPRSNAPSVPNDTTRSVEVVVKIGGALLAHPAHLQAVVDLVVDASREVRLAIVPGGGPFADTVRVVDASLGLPDDAAHWMAILGMDQYAHLLSSLDPSLAVVESASQVGDALTAGRVPVIAPYRWLREVDPLPNSWDVTSDSISAWISGELRSERLVLVKPPGVSSQEAVDSHFAAVLPAQIRWSVIPGDSVDELRRFVIPSVSEGPGLRYP